MFSVLISTYCKEEPQFLEGSLASIYDNQTLKPNQIVLVLDGPLTPELDAVIANWKNRLGELFTIVALQSNVGLGAALNEGLQHCKYELVARMDTDDVSMPDRFEKQVAFMEDNPEIVASSAMLEEWDIHMSSKLSSRLLPLDNISLKKFAKRRSPLNHAVAIFRKSIVIKVGGYPPLRSAQDYGLWSLLISLDYKLANIPEMLIKVRAGDEMITRRGLKYFKEEFKLLKFQKEIGFLSASDFILNIVSKAILRASPKSIKKIVYKLVRN